MQIQLNGNPSSIAVDSSVSTLLRDLNLPPTSVVVELNRIILQPDSYASTTLRDNDQVEIIRFVGGG